MLKTRVSCHFCNKDTHVFIIYKNSWECQECKQYNGFNKDGDYNKQIPEMQTESKKTFCLNNAPATPKKSTESKNLLCEKCNKSQEQKLKDLNNFEAKNEDNFDEEYKIFKSRLDHIYDLCRNCKIKLNQHLSYQDHQIGTYLSSNDNGLKANNLTPLKTTMKQSKIKKDTETDFQLKKRQVPLRMTVESGNTPVKKAYTVSGSAPYSQERQNLAKHSPSQPKYIYDVDMEPKQSPMEDYTSKVDKLLSTNLVKIKHSVSWDDIQTILVDILSFMGIILIFFCDIANLINDSGVWQDIDYTIPDTEQNLANPDQHYMFTTFLKIYKYAQIMLVLILSISIYLALKRSKVSRYLTSVGIFLNLCIHVNMFGMHSDEKFILEVLVSFMLSCYMSLARVYNVMQCYRYISNAY